MGFAGANRNPAEKVKGNNDEMKNGEEGVKKIKHE
jgi:hypothetical protein